MSSALCNYRLLRPGVATVLNWSHSSKLPQMTTQFRAITNNRHEPADALPAECVRKGLSLPANAFLSLENSRNQLNGIAQLSNFIHLLDSSFMSRTVNDILKNPTSNSKQLLDPLVAQYIDKVSNSTISFTGCPRPRGKIICMTRGGMCKANDAQSVCASYKKPKKWPQIKYCSGKKEVKICPPWLNRWIHMVLKTDLYIFRAYFVMGFNMDINVLKSLCLKLFFYFSRHSHHVKPQAPIPLGTIY